MRHSMSLSLAVLAFALAPSLPGQDAAPDPLVAARQKLHKSLAAMTALPSCGFEAKWGPDEQGKKKNDNNPGFVVFGGPGISSSGEATGAWQDEKLHVRSGDDEVLYAGRRMLARENGGEWALRRGHFRAGAELGFLPDPQLLLALLQDMELAVVHREAGSVGDRPVETLTVTLNPDQVAELTHAGVLPPMLGGMFAARQILVGGVAAGMKGAARQAPPPPDATVDLAFHIDPGTGMLHRLQVRTWSKGDGAQGGNIVVFAGGAGGGRVQVGGRGDVDDETEGEEDKPKEQKDGKEQPLIYEHGLPVRPRKKVAVSDFTLDLHEHGTAKVPALDDKARALLGR